ncbi:SOS response-associated peptidase family protein [Bradyrhizobium sp. AZCC 2230]|uniref:SOS response-associated peptidase family protein n=1 Tax=Bradyrhizobium sp. AZCC 2230 TaxID=3117021 RepID=UPI002FF12179
MEPDSGTTNIRNVRSKHWTRWLDPANRCVVPFNSFSEFNKAEGGDVWFALDESRPLACFGGIWANWTSVRKVKEGETTNDLYAFLTTEPNTEVRAIHPKAMPVILTTPHSHSLMRDARHRHVGTRAEPICSIPNARRQCNEPASRR